MNALLLIALLLACFELAVLFLLPAIETQNNTKRATNVPPADADEDADALPFGLEAEYGISGLRSNEDANALPFGPAPGVDSPCDTDY